MHIDYHRRYSTSWVLGTAAGYASPGNAMPLAGPDMLVVMIIGGGVTQEVTDFHSLKKFEYKSSFIGNDYQTGNLGKEVYNTMA